MNATLIKALVALAPVSLVLSWSMITLCRKRTISSFLQLLGAGFMVAVVLAHICEALHLFPFMRWGEQASIGHYLDLFSATLGLILFPLGYVFARREISKRSRARESF
jgi:hypothetical protein